MANFHFGKNLPKHELMQNLLKGTVRIPTSHHKSTQTESQQFLSETNYSCRRKSADFRGIVKAQIGKLENSHKVPQGRNLDFQDLMKSIKKRVVLLKNEDVCSCSGDSWSDGSFQTSPASVSFPKETRNALLDTKRTRAPKTQSIVANPLKPWSGFDERVELSEPAKNTNSKRTSIKITSKLSKNKLNPN